MPLRNHFRIHLQGGQYIALRRAHLIPGQSPLSPAAAWPLLESALTHPRDLNQLLALAQAISPGRLSATALQRALQSGEWCLLPAPRHSARPAPKPVQSALDEIKSAKLVKTWIEMEVVDDTGNPVSGLPFRCMLPDGSIHSGTLNSEGRVRFDGIDPGNVAFSLTSTHHADWDWAA